ncbi:MAG: hypothetical protein WDN45_06725 [Caulobacteraceae bacterium]
MFGGAIFLVSLIVSAASTNSSLVWVLQKAGQAFWPGFLCIFGVVTLVFAVTSGWAASACGTIGPRASCRPPAPRGGGGST